MNFRGYRVLVCAPIVLLVVLGLAACGGGGSHSASATDKASGLTISVAGDQVTLERSAKSTSGTAGVSGQVACTDDPSKLVGATAEPAPSEPWYSATLITWPAASKGSTATLSHALKNDPDLCIAETSDQSTQVVLYFRPSVKTDISKLQQAAQASPALQAAAQIGVTSELKKQFPAAAALVKAMTAKGFYVKPVAKVAGVTETGTIYLITSESTASKLVLAVKDDKGKVQVVTQGVTGAPKVTTAK